MNAYNFWGSGRNLTELCQGTWLEAVVIDLTLILQRCPLQNLGGQKYPKFSAILTTFDFDREYLRKVSTYRKSEKYLINYISSPIRRKNLVNFGPLTKTS